ncbi:MAG TPA: AAA family ATPase [Gemmataceae bacterium]|nr:AAA family ATPase [Gemmataceae bacterium]
MAPDALPPCDELEVVIFMGLQASGKSTFFRTRFASTHVHISKDNFRNNKNPSRRQALLLEEALREGRSVVIDNTNPTVSDRLPLITPARAAGARIVGYYFQSRLEDCQRRNRLRTGKACVPDVALYGTRSKLQPPTYSEGFDQLFHVRMTDESEWDISAWIEERKDYEAP